MHPRRAFGGVLHPLAVFYATVAELHPFPDGNSRTRMIFSQIETTRLGGHPLMLPDNGWAVYNFNNYGELHDYFCQGWCAYEYFMKHGKSPYVALSHVRTPSSSNSGKSRDTLQPDALHIGKKIYDSQNDKCTI